VFKLFVYDQNPERDKTEKKRLERERERQGGVICVVCNFRYWTKILFLFCFTHDVLIAVIPCLKSMTAFCNATLKQSALPVLKILNCDQT
jgi:hypothetical protein